MFLQFSKNEDFSFLQRLYSPFPASAMYVLNTDPLVRSSTVDDATQARVKRLRIS